MYSKLMRRWCEKSHFFNSFTTSSIGYRFGGERVVQAHRQVHFRLLQERAHGRDDADGRQRDTGRTPGVTPVGGQDFERPQYVIRVVERFAHAHVDHVGQLRAFGDRPDLIQNFAGGQVVRETLARRHAEAAAHPAARLRRNAQRRPLAVRDVGRFDEAIPQRREKVFFRAVRRLLYGSRRDAAYLISLFERPAVFQRNVRHLVDRQRSLPVNPCRDLSGREVRHPERSGDFGELAERFAEQPFLFHSATGLYK